MATKVLMPQTIESTLEGTVTRWLKNAGDAVRCDEPLFEIMMEGTISEILSPAGGVLSEILVPEGISVQINTVLAIISEAGAEQEEAMATQHDVAVAREQGPAANMEKADEEISPAPESENVHDPWPQRVDWPGADAAWPSIQAHDIRTSPLVRKLARENNIDLSEIRGTGMEGRIMKDDLLRYLARKAAKQPVLPEEAGFLAQKAEAIYCEATQRTEDTAGAAPEVNSAPMTAATEPLMGETEKDAMIAMPAAIAEQIVPDSRELFHASTFYEADVSAIVQLRERHQTEFTKREGAPLTYSAFFAKAFVDVVREFPILNSSVSEEGIICKRPVNLGIVVASDSGLIAPVIRDAHLKSFTGLALAINELTRRAQSKRLTPDDLQNGTASMANLGSDGGLFAAPVLKPPQTAILAIGSIVKRAVVIQDAIAIRSMVYLSLTFDNRVIDGALASGFMARLKERLQSWTQWMD